MSNANITVYHVTTDNVEQEHMRGTLWRKSGLNEPTYVVVPKCAKYLGEKYRLRFGLGQFINEQNIEFQLSDILYEYSDLHKVLMPSVLHTTHMNVYKLQNESYYLFVPNPSLGDDITFFFGWEDPEYIMRIYKKYPVIHDIIMRNIDEMDLSLFFKGLSEDDISNNGSNMLIIDIREQYPEKFTKWLRSITTYTASNDEFGVSAECYQEIYDVMRSLEIDNFSLRNGDVIFKGDYDYLVGTKINVNDMELTITKKYEIL
jgi:hypothetical protein